MGSLQTKRREKCAFCFLCLSARHHGASSSAPLLTKLVQKTMHQGVVRDMERQRVKRERELDFDMQRQLEAEYKLEQNVRNSLEPLSSNSAPPK